MPVRAAELKSSIIGPDHYLIIRGAMPLDNRGQIAMAAAQAGDKALPGGIAADKMPSCRQRYHFTSIGIDSATMLAIEMARSKATAT